VVGALRPRRRSAAVPTVAPARLVDGATAWRFRRSAAGPATPALRRVTPGALVRGVATCERSMRGLASRWVLRCCVLMRGGAACGAAMRGAGAETRGVAMRGAAAGAEKRAAGAEICGAGAAARGAAAGAEMRGAGAAAGAGPPPCRTCAAASVSKAGETSANVARTMNPFGRMTKFLPRRHSQ
jgi:hypothetical protein